MTMANKNSYKFIKTQDNQTKDTLLSLGFQMISDDGRTATFVNNGKKMNFDQVDLKKTTYSNKLEF